MDADEFRRKFGEDALRSMDRIDEDFVNAVLEYMPHLVTMAQAMADWDAKLRISQLCALAAGVGADPETFA